MTTNRGIDLCTCGKDRDHQVHVSDHLFFPNPQPVVDKVPVDVEKKVLEFLTTIGEVKLRTRFENNDSISVTTPDGDVWTMSAPTLRRKGSSS